MSTLLCLLSLGALLFLVLLLGAPGILLVFFLGLLFFGFLVGRKLRRWWRRFDTGEGGDDFNHLDQDKGSY